MVPAVVSVNLYLLMCAMRIQHLVCGSSVAVLALVSSVILPHRTVVEPVPSHVSVAVKYAQGGYVYMDHKIYKIGPGSQVTSRRAAASTPTYRRLGAEAVHVCTLRRIQRDVLPVAR